MRRTIRLAAMVLGGLALLAALNVIFGVIEPAAVEAWLEAMAADRQTLALAVVVVLTVDSLITVPTIATVVLAGWALGPLLGGSVSALGILLAGSVCFWGGRLGGRLSDAETLAEVTETVGRVGPVPLLVSRVMPMLPETLSVLAGMGGMPARRYYLFFALGNVPFAFLAAWAGSVSSLDRPWPAIAVGVGLPAIGAVIWWVRRRRIRAA